MTNEIAKNDIPTEEELKRAQQLLGTARSIEATKKRLAELVENFHKIGASAFEMRLKSIEDKYLLEYESRIKEWNKRTKQLQQAPTELSREIASVAEEIGKENLTENIITEIIKTYQDRHSDHIRAYCKF